MHKPQPEIYRLAAERLEVAPEECLFVDDLRENCEGAEAVGMTADPPPQRPGDDRPAHRADRHRARRGGLSGHLAP